MKKKLIFIFFFIVFTNSAGSEEKKSKEVVIQGDKQALELSDLPLDQYQYDDISFFTKNFEPQKELLSLLDKPDVLLGLINSSPVLELGDEE